MGMDVFGRKPISEEGKYFRANVWSWRPLHAMMHIASNGGVRYVDSETLRLMGHNDAAGIKTQKNCNLMANSLEGLLADPAQLRQCDLIVGRCERDPEEISISFKFDIDDPDEMLVASDGHFVRSDEIQTMTKEQKKSLHSPYYTTYSHVREFIKFLRACGGFKVC